MSRRSIISGLIAEQLAVANSTTAQVKPDSPEATVVTVDTPKRVSAGPVRAMGLSLDKLETERKSLESALSAGGVTVELHPDQIMISFASDRFIAADDPALEALKQSIKTSGQEVPILVRPLPDQPGKYQVAYGHRRLRACAALGKKVKALIRPMTDNELVIAQGLENANRVDLSFIEKAVFALDLEKKGFERSVIMTSLDTDKTELSKMLSAVKALPAEFIQAIGPAPRAGRRRWAQLAETIANPAALKRVMALMDDPEFLKSDSDSRFQKALALAIRPMTETALIAPHQFSIRGSNGDNLAKVRETPEQLLLSIDRKAHAAFADHLLRALPDLYARFIAEESQSSSLRRRT